MNAHHAIAVGARCAGGPTAMLLTREGRDVPVCGRAYLPNREGATTDVVP